MATKEDLSGWLIEALRANNGSASIVEVCKYVWNNYMRCGVRLEYVNAR